MTHEKVKLYIPQVDIYVMTLFESETIKKYFIVQIEEKENMYEKDS